MYQLLSLGVTKVRVRRAIARPLQGRFAGYGKILQSPCEPICKALHFARPLLGRLSDRPRFSKDKIISANSLKKELFKALKNISCGLCSLTAVDSHSL